MKIKLLYILFALLFFSCKNYVRIDYDKNYEETSKSIEKILVLPIHYFELDSLDNFVTSTKKKSELVETAKMAFDKINKEVIFTDSIKATNTPEYLNYLVPLKKDIIHTSDLHQDPYLLNNSDKRTTRKLFVQTPQIRPDYLSYSKKYDTPFVLFIGVVSNNDASYHYIILSDLEKSEILFRRLNLIDHKVTNSNLYPVIYNSLIEVFSEVSN